MHITNNLNFCSYSLNEEGGLNKENEDIGLWGIRRARYLWHNHQHAYAELIASGQAHNYYSAVNKKASAEYNRVLKEYIKDRKIKSIKNKDKKKTEMDNAIKYAEDIIYDKYIFCDLKGDLYER